MQKKLAQIKERLAQVQVDKILWKRGERKSLTQPSAECTLVFLKPEATMRGLMGEIITRIERKGFIISAVRLTQLTRKQAEKIYEIHKGKDFYEPLIEHVVSGPVLAMIIEGPNAVSSIRNMAGKTNPVEAQPGTIRGDYALITRKNMIHASDTLENANREIEIFFKPNEILRYKKPTESQYLL
jgi:nucleoside-diphosphate kinase